MDRPASPPPHAAPTRVRIMTPVRNGLRTVTQAEPLSEVGWRAVPGREPYAGVRSAPMMAVRQCIGGGRGSAADGSSPVIVRLERIRFLLALLLRAK